MSVTDNVNQSMDSKLETVLVMQGGGSLGAYECGAYKSLARHGVTFDIVAVLPLARLTLPL